MLYRNVFLVGILLPRKPTWLDGKSPYFFKREIHLSGVFSTSHSLVILSGVWDERAPFCRVVFKHHLVRGLNMMGIYLFFVVFKGESPISTS